MPPEKENTAAWTRFGTIGLKVLSVVILFPVLWLAIAFNAFGMADRWSALPGISADGGAVSGIVALVYLAGIFGLVVGGGFAMAGVDVSLLEGGEGGPESTPTATSQAPPTITTPPPTTTSTSTDTPSDAEHRQMQLNAFQEEYLNRVETTMENESLTGVPVLGSDYHETDEEELVLWVVYWECDFPDESRDQWITLANAFATAVSQSDGAQPDRVRIYSVVNYTAGQDEIAHIETSGAQALNNGSNEWSEYTQRWWDRKQAPSQAENETAYQIAINGSGREIAHTAFYVDHTDNDKASCNGGAKPGIESENRDEHEENTNDISLASPPRLHSVANHHQRVQ